jgi:hypothetical protein
MKLLRNIIIVSSAAIAEARSETRTRRNLKKDSYGGKSGKSRSSTTSSKSGKDGIVGFVSQCKLVTTLKITKLQSAHISTLLSIILYERSPT